MVSFDTRSSNTIVRQNITIRCNRYLKIHKRTNISKIKNIFVAFRKWQHSFNHVPRVLFVPDKRINFFTNIRCCLLRRMTYSRIDSSSCNSYEAYSVSICEIQHVTTFSFAFYLCRELDTTLMFGLSRLTPLLFRFPLDTRLPPRLVLNVFTYLSPHYVTPNEK